MLTLSENRKTKYSINLDHGSCRPTKLCKLCCYGRRVSAEEASKCFLKTNFGPITWPAQVAAYRRNREVLETASRQERVQMGLEIARRLLMKGLKDLRLCGMGDLTAGLLDVARGLMEGGIHPWGFSKKPELIRRMPAGSSMIASVDASMPKERVLRLMEATKKLMGRPTLAYMVMEPGDAGAQEIESLSFKKHLVVAFGYHTNHFQTIVNHPLMCPSTNGDGSVHCHDCERCITPRSV